MLSRCLTAFPTAKIHTSAWMKPSPAAMTRLPRIAKMTRIVSHETSTMRSRKISSAPHGEANSASTFTRRSHVERRLDRRDALLQRLVLLAKALDFGRDRIGGRHGGQRHRP